MIRCIAMDLDDTLLSDDLSISHTNELAIKEALQRGVKIILASGRMIVSMRPYAQKLKLDLPLISYNGAIISAALSGEIIYSQPIPKELTVQVISIFRQRGVHLNLYQDDKLYIDEVNTWSKKYEVSAGVPAYPVGDLVEFLKDPPPKLLGIGEIEVINQLQSDLQQQFGTQLIFTKSKPTYLEILAAGVSKGRALQFLAEKWGFDRKEVMAIGDAPNDLSMISWAGIGVAIGNANSSVKEQADWVVSDNNHNGVAEAIHRALSD